MVLFGGRFHFPPAPSDVDCCVDFRVSLFVSKWVGGYQVEVLPQGVFSLLSGRVCVDSEGWGVIWVGCMRVTGLGVLRVFF